VTELGVSPDADVFVPRMTKAVAIMAKQVAIAVTVFKILV
jgi:hypothetical protein